MRMIQTSPAVALTVLTDSGGHQSCIQGRHIDESGGQLVHLWHRHAINAGIPLPGMREGVVAHHGVHQPHHGRRFKAGTVARQRARQRGDSEEARGFVDARQRGPPSGLPRPSPCARSPWGPSRSGMCSRGYCRRWMPTQPPGACSSCHPKAHHRNCMNVSTERRAWYAIFWSRNCDALFQPCRTRNTWPASSRPPDGNCCNSG